jgi:hypothetical protein
MSRFIGSTQMQPWRSEKFKDLVEKLRRKAAQWRKYGLVAGEVIFVGSKLVFQYAILGMDFQLFSDADHVGLGPSHDIQNEINFNLRGR